MLLSMSIAALMALPPLDEKDLEHDADLVVTAKVEAVFTRVAPTKLGSDTRYLIQATVQSTAKGQAKPGQVIYVHAWRPNARPERWVGAQGQNVIPSGGDLARFHLRRAPDGALRALTPNGIQRVPPPAGE